MSKMILDAPEKLVEVITESVDAYLLGNGITLAMVSNGKPVPRAGDLARNIAQRVLLEMRELDLQERADRVTLMLSALDVRRPDAIAAGIVEAVIG